MGPSGRSFQSKSSFRMARQKMENSYRMEPKEKPNLTETLKLVELFITKTVKEKGDLQSKTKSFLEELSNNCHALVRKTLPARYRFVLQTFIIDDDDQSTNIQSRWLWNDALDDFGSISVNCSSFTIVIVLHTLYLE